MVPIFIILAVITMRGVIVLLVTLSLVWSTIQDDVTVEVEEEETSDIVYESPKPSGIFISFSEDIARPFRL